MILHFLCLANLQETQIHQISKTLFCSSASRDEGLSHTPVHHQCRPSQIHLSLDAVMLGASFAISTRLMQTYLTKPFLTLIL